MTKLPLYEKIGYATGDVATNLVSRGVLAYLAIFYTDTFGLTASAAAILFLVVRLSDGVTDIIIGMVADRTQTRWGKFRPWILCSTPLLALAIILCFITPDFSPTSKLIYAYFTYIFLTLAYTMNNIPYSALMGVMTKNHAERTSISGFRLAGGFAGGLLIMSYLPDLVDYFGKEDKAAGYQTTMYIIAGVLIALMVITFATTKERITSPPLNNDSLKAEAIDLLKNLPFIVLPLTAISLFFYYREIYSGAFFITVMLGMRFFIKKLLTRDREKLTSSQQDIVDLLTNKPWLVLLGIGFLMMMFNGIKITVIAYYFKYVIGNELVTGTYFIFLLSVSILGALFTNRCAKKWGKQQLFIVSLIANGVFTSLLYWVDSDNLYWVFGLGCIAEFFTAIILTLFFTMLGDSSDYSEWKNKRRATGLIYSSGTFIQKTGEGFATALVLIILAQYGYDPENKVSIEGSLPAMQLLMSWIPAAFAFLGAILMVFYPLNDSANKKITKELITRRQ